VDEEKIAYCLRAAEPLESFEHILSAVLVLLELHSDE